MAEAGVRQDIERKVMRRRRAAFSHVRLLSTLSERRPPDGEIPLPPVAIMKWLVACSLLMVAASSSCCVAATDTTMTTTPAELTLKKPAGADGTFSNHRNCPSTCFCDLDSSLVSCAGVEEDTIDVIWANRTFGGSSNNKATSVPVPLDIWSVVAAGGIQRLDVRDLILERIDKTLVNGTGRLNELSLVRCGLLRIGDATFVNHSNLERLDLSQNQLTTLTRVFSFFKERNNNSGKLRL